MCVRVHRRQSNAVLLQVELLGETQVKRLAGSVFYSQFLFFFVFPFCTVECARLQCKVPPFFFFMLSTARLQREMEKKNEKMRELPHREDTRHMHIPRNKKKSKRKKQRRGGVLRGEKKRLTAQRQKKKRILLLLVSLSEENNCSLERHGAHAGGINRSKSTCNCVFPPSVISCREERE